MEQEGFDTTSEITPEIARKLKAQGYEFVAGYYGSAWKRLSVSTVEALKAEEIYTVSLFEGAPTKASYFTTVQAASDAGAIIEQAKSVGQPGNSAIYLTVDYDAEQRDLSAILEYQTIVHGILKAHGYLVGIYGSGLVLKAVRAAGIASKFWLSNASGWQNYQEVFDARWWNLCQERPITIAGLFCDPDRSTGNAGGWLTTFLNERDIMGVHPRIANGIL